ncbi:FIG00553416: hypothetical protein [Cronobacter malonaticus 507]|nr:FIG00553416: hypothetical protein [Cronobacter malonaticus 507]
MLDDIKAIIPADALQVFINQLDDSQYATLECIQTEQNCSLIASAIVSGASSGISKIWSIAMAMCCAMSPTPVSFSFSPCCARR